MPTDDVRPMEQLSAEWAAIRHSAASRVALERLAEAQPAVARLGAGDLGDLVASLIGDRDADRCPGRRERAAALFGAVLRSAAVDPLVSRALVQALLPGLVGVARRLSWGAGGEWVTPAAFFSDAVATAWEVVTEWSGEDRPYAVLDVLSAVRCRLRRRVVRQRVLRRSEWFVEVDERHSPRAVATSSDLDELARAIERERGASLERADAAVLYAHRVLGYSLDELAQHSHRSRRFLAERRDRAAEALAG